MKRNQTTHAIGEALSAFAVPALREEMLVLALGIAGTSEVPEGVEALQRFLDGPLRTVVAGYLGDDVAEAVAAELAPMVSMLTSQVRAHHRPAGDDTTGVRSARTPAPQAPQAAQPVVLLATMSGPRVRGLTKDLEGAASVRVAEHVFALASGLNARLHRLPLVVIDLAAAPFDAAGLIALAPLLPGRTRIVLWGDPTRFARAIDRLRRAGVEFSSCGPEATSQDVAQLCRTLAGA